MWTSSYTPIRSGGNRLKRLELYSIMLGVAVGVGKQDRSLAG